MHMKADELRRFQSAALETIAQGGEFDRILNQLCSLVEQVICDSICLAVLPDELSGDWSVVSAPGAPSELINALNSPVPSDIDGTCGIAGGWSAPIFSSDDIAIGSLTVYRLKIGEPTAHEEQILVTASSIACTAIGQHRASKSPRVSEWNQTATSVQATHDLESLSAMAGSIAHEYNNLLAVIVGNADLAVGSGILEPPVSNWIADIQSAGMRAAELTRQLHTYAGQEIACVETIDLHALAADMAEHLGSMTSREIVYERQDVSESLYVSGDVLRIREIVMSLVGNTQEAIGTSADTIYIRTGVFTADSAYLKHSYAGDRLAEGDYVYIEVLRSGPGITDDDRRRIYDPFFTSATAGRGVGLATALGMIKRHNGALHLGNDPVAGSTFRAFFPRRILATAPAVSDAIPEKDVPAGTVLVVDDEPMVVSLAKRMLSEQGLRVLTACNGEQGVSIARQHVGDIDAVVLDATMPEMSGEETFHALREVCDDLPVIFCSGRQATYCLDLVEEKNLTAFVSKPFKAATLYEAVENLIETRESRREGANSGHEPSDLAQDMRLQDESPHTRSD